MAKKSTKKDTKPAKKAPVVEETDEIVTPRVTAKALASELGTDDRAFRKFLREVVGKENKPSGRWEWDEDDPQLDEIREAYAAKKAGKEADADSDEEVDEEFDEDDIDDID